MGSIWRRLIDGRLTGRKLPVQLNLSDIQNDMSHLWQPTAQDNKERGACILLDSDRLKLVHDVVGTRQGVQPIHRVGDSNDHLGFFHTHPLYPDGTEQVGFGEKDFAGALEDDEKLSVVRSGNHVFALLRTKRTRSPAPVSKQEVKKFAAIFDSYYAMEDLALAEAQLRANRDLCCWLGFAFYVGEFGQPLKRKLIPSLRRKLMPFLRRTLIWKLSSNGL